MCVYSMVLDHYKPLIPEVVPWIPDPAPIKPLGEVIVTGTKFPNFQIISQEEIDSIRKLIAEFKAALEAAKLIDKLTNQPDCEDPEKKKLEDRVALLEQQIAQMCKPTKRVKRPKKEIKFR